MTNYLVNGITDLPRVIKEHVQMNGVELPFNLKDCNYQKLEVEWNGDDIKEINPDWLRIKTKIGIYKLSTNSLVLEKEITEAKE